MITVATKMASLNNFYKTLKTLKYYSDEKSNFEYPENSKANGEKYEGLNTTTGDAIKITKSSPTKLSSIMQCHRC